jgi:hypothetical protein
VSDNGQEAVEQPVSAEVAQPQEEAAGTEQEQRVPLDRFRQVTTENRELREQLDELAKWKEEQEQAQLSELERERQAREKAEATAAEAATKAERLERSTWLKDAAASAGFADPEDAVALIGTAELDTAEAAQELVTKLAEQKPHLLAPADQAGPAPIGSPLGGSPATVDPDDPKAGLGADILGYLRGR